MPLQHHGWTTVIPYSPWLHRSSPTNYSVQQLRFWLVQESLMAAWRSWYMTISTGLTCLSASSIKPSSWLITASSGTAPWYLAANWGPVSEMAQRRHLCFAAGHHVTTIALRRIRSARRALPRHALLTMIRTHVVSKIDYCSLVLATMSGQLLSRLQSVLNAAAWLAFSASKSDHVSLLTHELHWLRVPARSGSGYAFWCTAAVTALLRHISPTISVEPATLTVIAVYVLPSLSLIQVGRGTDEPLNTRRPCTPSGCIKSVEWLAFLSHSRFVNVDVSSGTEDLSLPVEFSVTYLGRSLTGTVFSTSVAYLLAL